MSAPLPRENGPETLTLALTQDERDTLLFGLVCSTLDYQERMKDWAASVAIVRTKKEKARCREIGAQLQENIYKNGEMAARLGFRNGYPRPAAVPPTSGGRDNG